MPNILYEFPEFRFREWNANIKDHGMAKKEDITNYCRAYATHFKLWDDIQLNNGVKKIEKISNDSNKSEEWKVVRDDGTGWHAFFGLSFFFMDTFCIASTKHKMVKNKKNTKAQNSNTHFVFMFSRNAFKKKEA